MGVTVKRIAALVGVIGLTFFIASPAFANSLVATSPIAGATLKVAPSAVTISVEITPMDMGNEITVTDPAGRRVDDGTLAIAGSEAVVGLKNFVRSGIYTVTYSLASEGDAPLEGSFTFKFQPPSVISTANPTTEPTQSQTPASSSWGTNFFVILLLLLAVLVTIGLSLYARKLFADR